MAKTCGLCGYATNDPADFEEHMRRDHHWDQVVQRGPGALSNNAVILIVVVMTVLLAIPTVAGGLGTPFGVLSFLVMFGLVLRTRGPRVLLKALGAIAALYAALFVFGLILTFLVAG